jgi:hypothetical protein
VTDEQWEKIKELYQEQGFLVLERQVPGEAIGDVVTFIEQGKFPQPFRIIGRATEEEYRRQIAQLFPEKVHINLAGRQLFKAVTE